MEESAILTLHYADIFDFPLQSQEVHAHLYCRKASLEDVEKSLKNLLKKGLLMSAHGFYFFPGRAEIVSQRLRNSSHYFEKMRKAYILSRILGLIPWVDFIGVTGALAANNSHKEDDIDIMIITAPHRLWLGRALVVSFLKIFGLYRQDNSRANKFCPNVWLSRDNLNFSRENIFLAHEICQAIPLFDRGDVYNAFLESNQWITSFLPNWVPVKPKYRAKEFPSLLKQLGASLNTLSYRIQVKYMRERRTQELVSPSRALFHPKDVSPIVLKEFEKRERDLSSSLL